MLYNIERELVSVVQSTTAIAGGVLENYLNISYRFLKEKYVLTALRIDCLLGTIFNCRAVISFQKLIFYREK